MAAGHHWRRRRSAAPLYLEIVDHDTRRFTIEGPVASENAWVTEIARAQRTGRRLAFTLIGEEKLDSHLANQGELADYEQWPSRTIVIPQ